MSARYRVLPHTADLMVQVEASGLEELYKYSVESLLSIITDRRKIRKRVVVESLLTGDDDEDLLFNVLRWAFELVVVESFLIKEAEMKIEKGGNAIKVKGKGEPLDNSRHRINTEIKAVTMHKLEVSLKDGRYRGRFVLDV